MRKFLFRIFVFNFFFFINTTKQYILTLIFLLCNLRQLLCMYVLSLGFEQSLLAQILATYAIELYSKCLEVNSAPRFLLIDALSMGKSCYR